MEGQNKKNPALTGVIVLLILALAYGIFKYVKKDDTVVPQDTTTEVANTSLYKDGVYNAIGQYFSPGGEEKINVSVTLKNDVITDATVVSLAKRPESVQYQGKFVSGIKPLIIGKKINEVNVSKVSGSSLTSLGFNNALDSIKASALQ